MLKWKILQPVHSFPADYVLYDNTVVYPVFEAASFMSYGDTFYYNFYSHGNKLKITHVGTDIEHILDLASEAFGADKA